MLFWVYVVVVLVLWLITKNIFLSVLLAVVLILAFWTVIQMFKGGG